MNTKPLVLAHRGVMNLAPENTKLAFQLAHLFGFEGVELDVHMSLDKKLVIIHDENTKRTANEDFLVSNTSLEKLKTLNYAASWKHTLPKQHLLTLEEFFSDFLSFFQVVNIELKTDVCEYPGIEEQLAALIQTLPADQQQKLLISSFNFHSLERFKKLLPTVKLAFLFYRIKDFRKQANKISSICDFLNPRLEVYLRYSKEIDELNKKYFFWTINSLRAWNKALSLPLTAGVICNQLFA